MSRILVQELKTPGHCAPYALQVVQTLLRGGEEVVLALNGRLRGQFESLASKMDGFDRLSGLEVHWIDDIETEWNTWSTTRIEIDVCHKLMKQFEVDRVVLPSADSIAVRLLPDIRRARSIKNSKVPWDLVVHAVWPSPGVFGKRIDKKILNRCCLNLLHSTGGRVLIPDSYFSLGPGRARIGRGLGQNAGFVPHPFGEGEAMSQREAREHLQLPTDGRLLVIPGALDMRKAIDRLVDAFGSLSGIVDGVVMAGPMGSRVRACIETIQDSMTPKLYVIDEFLDAVSFRAAVYAADVIWAVYPNWRGMSSVQLLSATYGIRCIIDRTHVGGVWFASQGEGCTVLDGSVAEAVHSALKGPAPNASYQGFAAACTSHKVHHSVLIDGVTIQSIDELYQHSEDQS